MNPRLSSSQRVALAALCGLAGPVPTWTVRKLLGSPPGFPLGPTLMDLMNVGLAEYVTGEAGGWRITDKGRDVLRLAKIN